MFIKVTDYFMTSRAVTCGKISDGLSRRWFNNAESTATGCLEPNAMWERLRAVNWYGCGYQSWYACLHLPGKAEKAAP